MEHIAKFKRKKRIYLSYVGMEWSQRNVIINGILIENIDQWLSDRIDVLINERNIVATDTEEVYKELENFFLKVKYSLCGIFLKCHLGH